MGRTNHSKIIPTILAFLCIITQRSTLTAPNPYCLVSTIIYTGQPGNTIDTLEFSPEDTELAFTGFDRCIRVCHTNEHGSFETKKTPLELGKEKRKIDRTMAFSPSGDILAATGSQKKIHIWHKNTYKKIDTQKASILEGHTKHIHTLLFNSNGTKLVTAGNDTFVLVWHQNDLGEFDSGNKVQLYSHTSPVLNLVFSHDNTMLVSAGRDKKLQIWYENDQREIDPQRSVILEDQSHDLSSVAFSSDDNILVSAGKDSAVKIWHRSDKRSLISLLHKLLKYFKYNEQKPFENQNAIELKGAAEHVRELRFSHDGNILALGTDTSVQIWHKDKDGKFTSQNTQQLQADGQKITDLYFSYDDSKLAAIVSDCIIRIWCKNECEKFDTQPTINLEGHSGNITALAFSHDSTKLASTGSDQTVQVWDISAFYEQSNQKEDDKKICCICYDDTDSQLQCLPCINPHRELIHPHCLQQLIEYTKSCPICREKMDLKNLSQYDEL